MPLEAKTLKRCAQFSEKISHALHFELFTKTLPPAIKITIIPPNFIILQKKRTLAGLEPPLLTKLLLTRQKI